jgi:hypothetical protein
MANYNPNDAAAFNKLIQNGLSTADAAKQAGITPEAASQYALGNNNNLGSLNPGVGAAPATDLTTFPVQPIPQALSGQPAQGVQLASAAPLVLNGTVNRDGTITFFTPGQNQTLSPGPPTTTTQNVGPFATGYRGVAGPLEQAPPLPNSTVVPVDVTGPPTADNAPRATPSPTPAVSSNGQPAIVENPRVNSTTPVPAVSSSGQTPAASDPVPATNQPFTVEVVGTGTNQNAAEDARLARAPGPVFNTPGAAQDGQGGTTPEPFRVEVTGTGFVAKPGELGSTVTAPEPFRVEVTGTGFVAKPGELGSTVFEPKPVFTGQTDEFGGIPAEIPAANPMSQDPMQLAANQEAAAKNNTIQQATLQSTYKQPGNGDWRFRISLAEGADYLYKVPDNSNKAGGAGGSPGILAPLATTNGVVFPYTPQVTTSYQAKYNTYDLIHSNYRGVFYQSSGVSEISVRGVFTAQDTREGAYVLAVIHFFRSVTKMFYGQDSQRGAPPPLVYLTGLGDYQFNQHPAVVTNFEYSLPDDVDYIRADNPNNFGTDLLNRRAGALNPPSNPLSAIATRLGLSGLFPGATPTKPSYGAVTNSVTNTAKATYVPTKININVSLLPVQTRDQVSKLFSLKDFATGSLLRGGFW